MRHFCVNNVIITMTTLIIRIHALIDFVIFLGISISCTLTNYVACIVVKLNWLSRAVVCLLGLGGPEKCFFVLVSLFF